MTPARTVMLAVLVILLPTLIFASVVVAFNAYYGRQAVQLAALDRARAIMINIDADLARSAGALRVLATSGTIKQGDWAVARARAQEIQRLNSDWRSVELVNLESGEVLFTTLDDPRPALIPAAFRGAWKTGQVTYGGIARRRGRCTCALMGERLSADRGRLALLVELNPERIQQMVLAGTPPGAVSAVVDREGNFLGRSMDYANRAGTPATIYVRSALRRGSEGFYEGKTYEGLDNLTAFVKSPDTGWSTHMAVSSELVSSPQQRFYMALGIATVLALAFGTAIVLVMLRSLSARRIAEARLRDAEHLEALGRLASGAAHDFNNMLAIIAGNLELAMRSPDLSGKVRRNLDIASQGARRAADLTRRMLSYARRQEHPLETTDPCEVVRETSVLLDRTLGDHIRLRCLNGNDVWPVRVDRSELQNAIVNLAVNARDAMPAGGEIVIETANAPAGSAVGGEAVPTDSVLFRISDTGEGIAPEVIDRVADPFFTTKGPGNGTGLGLSQVLGFTRQSGGDLRIVSAAAKGTDIFIILPRDLEAAGDVVGSAARAPGQALPRLRIMLVDDEEQVLSTTLDALRELGQEPVAFSSPAEALTAIRQGAVYDLLVTDNQMPEISGTELIARAREHRPGLVAVLISALPFIYLPNRVRALAKPFSIDQLRNAIVEAIGEDASPATRQPPLPKETPGQ